MIVSECFYPEEFKINDVALAWKDQVYEVTVLTLAPTYPLGYHLRILRCICLIEVAKANNNFKMLKFRSMLIDTPNLATYLIGNSYSHITPIGGFLRLTSLDELP